MREKASKLRAYYLKICEDEQKSVKRNQDLLKDLQRIDSQFQAMESKLERLANLKVNSVFVLYSRKIGFATVSVTTLWPRRPKTLQHLNHIVW